MKRALLVITMVLGYPSFTAAQGGSAACGHVTGAAQQSAAAFVECARLATEKYKDRAVAILDGYRRIGRDFPGMGEHWINIALVFDSKFDAAHPEVLSYIVVSGIPRLLGVAYALPLLKGESPPEWLAGRDAWHDHFRTVEEESALSRHHSAGGRRDRARLAMLHAWIWAENPAGTFAADNWAIPYLRLGIPPPADGPAAAAKALSLVTGGAENVLMSIDAAAAPTQGERLRIQGVLAQSRAAVEAWLRGGSGSMFTPHELDKLFDIWSGMWAAIDASVSQETRAQLQHLPIR